MRSNVASRSSIVTSSSPVMSSRLTRSLGSWCRRREQDSTHGVRAGFVTAAVLALAACGGGGQDIDVDAGVERHLALTDQTIEDFDGRCAEFDDGELCGEDFLRQAIEDDCHNDVDDPTDRASWAILSSADPDVAAIQLEVMSVACPDNAAEWIAFELGS